MGKVISHLKLPVEHGHKFRILLKIGFQGFKHHPFTELFGGVHIIEFLLPFRKVGNLGPLALLRTGSRRLNGFCHLLLAYSLATVSAASGLIGISRFML